MRLRRILCGLVFAALAIPAFASAQGPIIPAESPITLTAIASEIFEVGALPINPASGYVWQETVEPKGYVYLADKVVNCPGGSPAKGTCVQNMLFAVDKRKPASLTLRYVKPGAAPVRTVKLSIDFVDQSTLRIREIR